MVDRADVDLQQLRASLEGMVDGFAIYGSLREDGEIVDFEWRYANAAGAATFNRTPSDLIGTSLCSLRPRLKASGMFDRFCGVVESGKPLSIKQLTYTDEGVDGTFDLRAWKLDDGFAVTWRDETDRERALQELRSSEERFRTCFDQLHEAVSVLVAVRDSRGAIVDFRWEYANAAASEMIGYYPGELDGRLLLEVLPAHEQSGMLDVHRGVVETGQPYVEPRLWYEDVWGDGQRKRRAFDVRGTKLQDGLVVVAREVTEEQQHEADLARQRTELQRAYAEMLDANERSHAEAQAERRGLEAQLQQSRRLESLGQLAGGIAHDFNNLLGAILNYSAFVTNELDAQLAAGDDPHWRAVRDDVGQISRAAERATELTRQLLAFGRREVVQPRVLDLNEVVANVEHLLRRTLGEHVELHTSLAPELGAVLADPGQLEQVLVNLAVNARDAMPSGGTLTIETTNVRGDHDVAPIRPDVEPGQYVQLRVSDTGDGADAEVRAHAFDPFFTTKPKGEGTGLGLATVYGIIKQAGGHAEICSEPGRGLTFIARLPVTDRPFCAVSAPALPQPVGGSETVLVVEDEDAMREVIRRILVENGYRVITASSGDEALLAAEAHSDPIDVLLTDVVMPGMLGTAVAERFVELREGIRVLYMSGYAQPVFESQGPLEPGVHLLKKPFSDTVLLSALRQALAA